MNLAHLHLILTHVPVIGIPLTLSFLVVGYLQGNWGTQRFAFLMLAAIAVVTVATYFTGEPAEEVVEHLPGVAESFIEAHEDAALVSFVLTLLTGLTALSALWFRRNEKLLRYAVLGTMLIAAVSTASLAYTASLGGRVRHTEIRPGNAPVQTEGTTEKDQD